MSFLEENGLLWLHIIVACGVFLSLFFSWRVYAMMKYGLAGREEALALRFKGRTGQRLFPVGDCNITIVDVTVHKKVGFKSKVRELLGIGDYTYTHIGGSLDYKNLHIPMMEEFRQILTITSGNNSVIPFWQNGRWHIRFKIDSSDLETVYNRFYQLGLILDNRLKQYYNGHSHKWSL